MNAFALLMSMHVCSQLASIAAEDVLTFPLLNEHSMRNRALVESTTDRSQQLIRGAKKKIRTSPELLPVFMDYGAYYIDMFVGTPPQRQTVMLDTGSENIAIPCTGCDNCGDTHTDKHFQQSKSDSFHAMNCSQCFDGVCAAQNNTCNIYKDYVEGSSWKGLEVEDYAYAGGGQGEVLDMHMQKSDDGDTYSGTKPENAAKNRFPLKFTCMTSNEGEFKKQKADGIMGLNTKKASFWRQMHDQGAISSRKFSLCVRKFPYVPLEPKTHFVGAMTLGGVDSRLDSSPTLYMDFDINNSRNLFAVQIRKIHVHPNGGSRLVGGTPDIDLSSDDILLASDDTVLLNKHGMIVDSGTTDSILPKELKPALDKVWEMLMGSPFPTEAVDMSVDELKTWPTIIFQMKGSTEENSMSAGFDKEHPRDLLVAFPPSSYMRLNVVNSKYVPALSMHNDFGISILGSNFMRGHNVLFDIDNSRIGMAESTCDYKLLMTGEAEEEFMDPYPTRDEIIKSYRQNYADFLCYTNNAFCYALWTLKLLPIVLFWVIMIFSVIENPPRFCKRFLRRRSIESEGDYTKLLIKNSDGDDGIMESS